MYEFDDTGNGSRLFSAETSNSYIMEPQIDLFWLVATLCAVFGANGVYRRIRYRIIRRRRGKCSRPAIVLGYLSGHLTSL